MNLKALSLTGVMTAVAMSAITAPAQADDKRDPGLSVPIVGLNNPCTKEFDSVDGRIEVRPLMKVLAEGGRLLTLDIDGDATDANGNGFKLKSLHRVRFNDGFPGLLFLKLGLIDKHFDDKDGNGRDGKQLAWFGHVVTKLHHGKDRDPKGRDGKGHGWDGHDGKGHDWQGDHDGKHHDWGSHDGKSHDGKGYGWNGHGDKDRDWDGDHDGKGHQNDNYHGGMSYHDKGHYDNGAYQHSGYQHGSYSNGQYGQGHDGKRYDGQHDGKGGYHHGPKHGGKGQEGKADLNAIVHVNEHGRIAKIEISGIECKG